MPQRKSAKKELKKSIKRRKLNLIRKKIIKEAIKKYKKFLQNKDLENAKQALREVYKALDKAARKKTIHPKKAAREKSKYASLINQLT